MESYSGFAYVYDRLMEDVDYNSWTDYIEKIFYRYGKEPKNIVDLACGTGNITNSLAKRGYNLIGVDISESMLMIAQEKAMDMSVEVIYLNQDMRRLELPTELDAILCICDGINYITNDKDLKEIFASVYRYLKSEGLFIFDISSYYKLSHILGHNTFAENYEEVSYIWENYFDEEKNVCDFDLTLFIKDGKGYRKHEENHCQRAYGEEEILSLLKTASFSKIEAFEAFSFNGPQDNTERIYFVCQK
ncbi:MAG: class I SAM-dependent methyltransferase [Thermotaleaceae bacterium]